MILQIEITPPFIVVDENRDAAAMPALLVEALGHDVIVGNGWRQDLEVASIEVPEVSLLDIGLPEMDGNELAQRLRAQPETAKSILIAETGYVQENERGYATASGFDHHMVKPVDLTKLSEVLASVDPI